MSLSRLYQHLLVQARALHQHVVVELWPDDRGVVQDLPLVLVQLLDPPLDQVLDRRRYLDLAHVQLDLLGFGVDDPVFNQRLGDLLDEVRVSLGFLVDQLRQVLRALPLEDGRDDSGRSLGVKPVQGDDSHEVLALKPLECIK